ncbi:MAG: ion transporter, partial [Lachnospiraceae bacterium]|nr:ion transporter [Lachnospiraceae bacterium]
MAGKAKSVKNRLFKIIQIGNSTDIPSMCFDIFIVLVILVNIAVTFLQTFEGAAEYAGALRIVEFITMAIFLVEYVLRIWT